MGVIEVVVSIKLERNNR